MRQPGRHMKRRSLIAFALLILVSLAACDSVSDLVSEDPEDLVVLTVNPATIPADGASVSTLKARIPAGIDPNIRFVTFTTSAGTFVDGSIVSSDPIDIDADTRGVATVQLRSTVQPGTAIVRAKSGSLADQETVNFGVALPEQVIVSTDLFMLQVSTADTTTVTAMLHRAVGVATSGTVVAFSAMDAGGGPIGGFSSVTPSDSAGEATAVYSPGATAYRGDVTIRATVTDPASGATVEGQTTVQITD